MKWTVLIATAVTLVSLDTSAATRHPTPENSPDVLRPQQLKKSLAHGSMGQQLTSPLATVTAAAPTADDVGDADSFGKNVTWLGLAQTMPVTIQDDCSGSDPAFERCIVQQPAPLATNFNETGLAVMNLPAKASKDLLCFTFTPFLALSWANNTATQQTAIFTAFGSITIDNAVLSDPTLIDPNTGSPFNGSLTVSLSSWHEFKSIEPGQFESVNQSQSRACVAGLISKSALTTNYGLTDAQATQFFKKPMAIHFGTRGSVQMQEFAQYFYGIRLFGD